jgi:oligosaccharide repeat unit polymerase
MIIAGIILYIILLIVLIYLFRAREGYLSTITVFGFSSFIFYLIIPLESVISKNQIVIGSYLPFFLDSNLLEVIVVMSLISLISFSIGYFLSGFYPFKKGELILRISNSRSHGTAFPFGLIFLLIITVILLLIVFRTELLAVNTYFGNYFTSYTSPIFSYTVSVFTYFIAILASYHILSLSGFSRVNLSLIVMLIVWGVYSSNKNPILLGLLSASVYFLIPKKKEEISKLLFVIVGGIFFLFSFPLFSLFRAGFRGLDLLRNYYFSTTLIDPAGPFYSLLYSLTLGKKLYGITYISDLMLIIPKWIWEERPLGTAVYFAKEIIPNWQPGQGLGYSFMAEAYQNFGVTGAFLQYFLIGLLWGMIWNILKKHFSKINYIYFQSIYFTIGFYMLILMHRAPVIGLVKNMLHIICLLLPVSLIFHRYYLFRGKLFRKFMPRNQNRY